MDDFAAVRFAADAITAPHDGCRGLRSAIFDLEHDIAVAMSELKRKAGEAAAAADEGGMRAALEARARLATMYAPTRVAGDSLLMVLTVMFRLEWYRALREAGTLERRLEEDFVLADIVLFFAEARSLCDRLAEMIARSAKKSGELSDSSLSDLTKWVLKHSARASRLLDTRLLAELEDMRWFTSLRDARGDITHRNRQMLKLNANDHRILLVLTAEDTRSSIRVAPSMMQGIAVDFGMYAAVTLAHILVLIDAIAPSVTARCAVEPRPGPTRSNGFRTTGVTTFHDWLKRAEAALAAPL